MNPVFFVAFSNICFRKMNIPLKHSDSSNLQVVNEFLVQAWKNFFNDKAGKVGKPKLGYIKTSKNDFLKNCKVKRYTLYLEANRKYCLSLQVEGLKTKELPKTNKVVGIDGGVADLVILSAGIKYSSFCKFNNGKRPLEACI